MKQRSLFKPRPIQGGDDAGRAEALADALTRQFAQKLPTGSVYGPLFETQMDIAEEDNDA
jgi:hypothetical protein